MITLRTPRESEIVRDTISDPEGYTLGMGLLIGGEDYTERFFEGAWGQQAIPITLDGSVAGYLPTRLDGEKVELFVSIDGIKIPQLLSEKMEFLPGEGLGITDMLASSPGAYFNGDDAIKLNEEQEYIDLAPEDVVRDAALRLPYEKSLISVDEVSDITLNYSGFGDQAGFRPEDAAGDVLSRVEETVGYLYRDTVYKGFRGSIPRPLSRGQAVPEFRAFTASDIPDWLRPARTSLRYYDVRVYRENPDGTLAFESREVIPYQGIKKRPLPGQTLNIVLDDESGVGSASARRRAVLEALEQGRATYGGQLTFPAFDPLVELEDRFSIYERFENNDGLFERLWLMKILSYSNPYGTESTSGSGGASSTENLHAALVDAGSNTGVLATMVAYSAAIVEEEKVYVPTLIIPRSALSLGSTGVLRTPTEPVGLAAYGVSGDYIYFDFDRVAWVRAEGDYLTFDDAGPVRVEGDYIVVEEA